MSKPSVDSRIRELFNSLTAGDRVAIGKACTLVESQRPEDRRNAIALLDMCSQKLTKGDDSFRLTISGPPGVGKSTLLEAIGQKAILHGHKVGVLTVDPTSSLSKGSILGDKSRMLTLGQSENAFIRSSPAGLVLGGIARRSRELMTILAAAGFDLIFFETVGVGQSEHIAWHLTDGFILVIQPGSGDELQGIKRGITELADIVIVNKTDSSLQQAGEITKGHFQRALHYFSSLREDWQPRILTTSATEDRGIEEFWEILRLYLTSRKKDNRLTANRRQQDEYWLSWTLGITAHDLLLNHPVIKEKLSHSLDQLKTNTGSLFNIEFEIEEAMRALMSIPNHQQNT